MYFSLSIMITWQYWIQCARHACRKNVFLCERVRVWVRRGGRGVVFNPCFDNLWKRPVSMKQSISSQIPLRLPDNLCRACGERSLWLMIFQDQFYDFKWKQHIPPQCRHQCVKQLQLMNDCLLFWWDKKSSNPAQKLEASQRAQLCPLKPDISFQKNR